MDNKVAMVIVVALLLAAIFVPAWLGIKWTKAAQTPLEVLVALMATAGVYVVAYVFLKLIAGVFDAPQTAATALFFMVLSYAAQLIISLVKLVKLVVEG